MSAMDWFWVGASAALAIIGFLAVVAAFLGLLWLGMIACLVTRTWFDRRWEKRHNAQS